MSRLTELGRALIGRLVRFELIDRSLVIGAQAFSALVPLLIVLASTGTRDGRSFGELLVRKFDLSGDAADTVLQTFDAPADDASITVLGALLVVFSALAFTRALQRTFQLAWELPRLGIAGTKWGLIWLVFFVGWWTLVPFLARIGGPLLHAALTLGGSFVLWLVTPYLLLAMRIPWQRLTVQAAISAIGMTVLQGAILIYAPEAIENSAGRFGAIGVAFTLLSIMWSGGFVLAAAAAIGSFPYTSDWPERAPWTGGPEPAAQAGD